MALATDCAMRTGFHVCVARKNLGLQRHRTGKGHTIHRFKAMAERTEDGSSVRRLNQWHAVLDGCAVPSRVVSPSRVACPQRISGPTPKKSPSAASSSFSPASAPPRLVFPPSLFSLSTLDSEHIRPAAHPVWHRISKSVHLKRGRSCKFVDGTSYLCWDSSWSV